MVDDASLLAEAVEARTDDRRSTGERRVLGDADEQRAAVDVAGADDCLHLERRPARMGPVDEVRVVHDALEHRDAPDDHVTPFRPRRRLASLTSAAFPARP